MKIYTFDFAYGYGLALALDAELGGANSTPHPAKKAQGRGELAANTGITGGPPTRHPTDTAGAGLTRAGRVRVPNNIDWPSKDASPLAVRGRETLWRQINTALRLQNKPEITLAQLKSMSDEELEQAYRAVHR